MNHLLLFRIKAISTYSVLESGNGDNLDFIAVPATNLINIVATKRSITLYLKEANGFSSDKAEYAQVTLTTENNKEVAVVKSLWKLISRDGNQLIEFNDSGKQFPVDYITGIESIKRSEVERFTNTATDVKVLVTTVYNSTVSTIDKDIPVHIVGTTTGGIVSVIPARADTASAMPAQFITSEAITGRGTGQAILYGPLETADTSSFTVADILYVGATGGLTATAPGGANVDQKIATVAEVATKGILFFTGDLTIS
jgi:hypothetical protein